MLCVWEVDISRCPSVFVSHLHPSLKKHCFDLHCCCTCLMVVDVLCVCVRTLCTVITQQLKLHGCGVCTNRSRASALTPVMSEVQELRGIFLRGYWLKCLAVCVCLFLFVFLCVCLCNFCWLTPDVHGLGCQQWLERVPLYVCAEHLLLKVLEWLFAHMANINIFIVHPPDLQNVKNIRLDLVKGSFNKENENEAESGRVLLPSQQRAVESYKYLVIKRPLECFGFVTFLALTCLLFSEFVDIFAVFVFCIPRFNFCPNLRPE